MIYITIIICIALYIIYYLRICTYYVRRCVCVCVDARVRACMCICRLRRGCFLSCYDCSNRLPICPMVQLCLINLAFIRQQLSDSIILARYFPCVIGVQPLTPILDIMCRYIHFRHHMHDLVGKPSFIKRTLTPYFRNLPLLHITIRLHLTWRLLKFIQWLARKQYLLRR